MTRFGGAAEVGKAYDEYGNKQGMSSGTKTALAGVGVGAFGAHQLVGSRNVGDRAEHALQRISATHKQNKKRLKEVASTTYDAKVGQRLSPGPVKLLHRGKVKRANEELAQVTREYQKTKRMKAAATAANTPGEIARRTRGMRVLGGAALAGGALTAASPLFRRKPQPAPVPEATLVKADISKTITQARYGGNAEMGRAWRGEEKRNVPKEIHAVGAGGAALLGGGIAAGVGHRRLKSIKPVEDTKPHEARHRFAVGERASASTAEDAAHGVLSAEMKGHKDYLNTKGRRRAGIKHPSHGADAPGYRGLPGKPETPTRAAIPPTTPGIVGPEGGGFGHRETHLKGEHAHAKRTTNAANLVEENALKDIERVKAANASRIPRIASATRLKRGGLAVAALGGAGALGAAAKIEHDRRTGFKKPVRKDLKEDLEGNTRQALNMKSKAKKKKSGKLSEMGNWKTHAVSQDVDKALPIRMPLDVGLAATKTVTPRPIRNVVRTGKEGFLEGFRQNAMTQAERRAMKEVGHLRLQHR